MESEKVKEIKKALEQNDDNGIMYEVNDEKRTCKFIHHKDILTLINELESENERYKQSCGAIGQNSLTIINQLKDRIAELEKDNELLRNAKVVYENVDYCYEDLKKAEKRIAELELGNEALSFAVKQGFNDCQTKTLKQFAERLKEKCDYMDSCDYGKKGVFINDIDETLKEFINGKERK